jgi:hypothetical protein
MDNISKGAQWEAQVLRLSVFLRSPFDGAAIWEELVGQKPENDDLRPREGQRIQSGTLKDGILEISVTSARFDIVRTPAPSAEGVITFGPLDSCATEFLNLVSPWLIKAPIECVRLAFGAVAVKQASSREEIYDILAELVPSVKFDAANSREVLYRVNHPATSSIIDGHVNRITTWNGILFRRLTSSAAGVQFQKIENHFARLECDVSSSEFRSDLIPTDKLGPLLSEFVGLALENAKRGELP